MQSIPFSTALLAFVLLGTLGCSQKTDPLPVTDTGSYEIAGQRKTCSATATTSTPSGQTTVAVLFTTVPQPASGPEVLNVAFTKAAGQPASAYRVTLLALGSNGAVSLVFSNQAATLTSTNNAVSGTFSASGFYSGASANASITNDIFTNVHL